MRGINCTHSQNIDFYMKITSETCFSPKIYSIYQKSENFEKCKKIFVSSGHITYVLWIMTVKTHFAMQSRLFCFTVWNKLIRVFQKNRHLIFFGENFQKIFSPKWLIRCIFMRESIEKTWKHLPDYEI